MNIKEYISSGVLEAYVLGDLSEHERAALERNLMLYPELRKELAKIEEANEAFFMKTAVEPDISVKEKLFSHIDSRTNPSRIVPLSRRKVSPIWRYAAAASIAIAIVSSYLAYSYWDRWKAVSSDLTQLVSRNEQVAKNYKEVQLKLNKIQRDLEIIDNPLYEKVTMTGTANAPGALATVYWNQSTEEVYVRIHGMKKLAKEKQYQLWAIIDGKPVDAGVFDLTMEGLVKMKNAGNGVTTFAVTIEPRGGSDTPSLETLQVAGSVMKG